ncbi:Na+/H+ antiporter subunit E [Bartonella vinsonii]|uniref:Putative monovalent cation/H+ antiporter subunit E n=1 Tax=Bartonella vinsonii subsp. berkhoffii str. Tweed TaxID=1094502 RepID=N6UL61_BARVB|nr:Na+/H+ antiporter subunit E [Bartonella vinsonii]AGF76567.1 putative monovalent cation/H+ antiporter subunit E [Bartonella vinsonii subsp. berkhoffii str. Winnie]ENN93114.1 putative monovalent cation/H+ antiporter subunit E [Bartonella vinsonii subsp. berkhoffii str. Tweed]
MNSFCPFPFFSAAIVFMWLTLNGFSIGQLLLGIIIALLSGWVMQFLELEKITLKNWRAIFRLIFRVFIDSIVSNVAVAFFVLTKRIQKQQSGFIVVPLLLESYTGLAVLACILAITPGTVWIAYNRKNGELLLHVLNLKDGYDYQQLIKQRYEKLLLEIFS